jgi:hypothetical protein
VRCYCCCCHLQPKCPLVQEPCWGSGVGRAPGGLLGQGQLLVSWRAQQGEPEVAACARLQLHS